MSVKVGMCIPVRVQFRDFAHIFGSDTLVMLIKKLILIQLIRSRNAKQQSCKVLFLVFFSIQNMKAALNENVGLKHYVMLCPHFSEPLNSIKGVLFLN
jgi:hypothetical protein